MFCCAFLVIGLHVGVALFVLFEGFDNGDFGQKFDVEQEVSKTAVS